MHHGTLTDAGLAATIMASHQAKEKQPMNEITSYQDIEKIAYGRELPLMGTNADGECVLLSFGRTTADGTKSYVLDIFQDNGVTCSHVYWEDGIKEETFSR